MLIDYDAAAEAITPRTKAIIPVSLFGNPLDYERLDAIKARHGVAIVEDAACAVGAEYGGRKVGPARRHHGVQPASAEVHHHR